MDAVISGRAGKALVLDDGVLRSFDLNDAREFVPRKREDVRVLLGESNDVIVIENASREEIIHRLEIEKSSATALDLTLISLDPELSDGVRMEAVEALDELLSDANVVAKVEETLYAKPLPAIADLAGALTFCGRTNAGRSQSFFERLEYNQPQIRKTRYAWESIPPAVFGGAQLKSEFHDLAVREGLFRDLSTSSVDKARIGLFLLNALRNESVRSMRNHRDVLQQWSDPLSDGTVDGLTKLELAGEATERPKTSFSLDELMETGGDGELLNGLSGDIDGKPLGRSPAEITIDEIDALLKKALARRDRDRNILIFKLRYCDGLTLEQIRDALGLDISPKGIASILNRVTARMRLTVQRTSSRNPD